MNKYTVYVANALYFRLINKNKYMDKHVLVPPFAIEIHLLFRGRGNGPASRLHARRDKKEQTVKRGRQWTDVIFSASTWRRGRVSLAPYPRR